MPRSERNDFFFEDLAAGYFEDQLPSIPGEYRYMPYRGPGHLRFVQELASGSQRCHYLVQGEKHYFTVLSLVGHGILQVH